MGKQRTEFTTDDESLLVKYLARYNPDGQNRTGNKLYETLVKNEKGKWSFASRHPAQSWRQHYLDDQERFDRLIAQRIRKDHGGDNPPSAPRTIPSSSQNGRQPFTEEEDLLLAQYIAEKTPTAKTRLGNTIYKELVENLETYPWARTHPWQSWRERYKKHQAIFDRRIARYLKNLQKQQAEAAESRESSHSRDPGPSKKRRRDSEGQAEKPAPKKSRVEHITQDRTKEHEIMSLRQEEEEESQPLQAPPIAVDPEAAKMEVDSAAFQNDRNLERDVSGNAKDIPAGNSRARTPSPPPDPNLSLEPFRDLGMHQAGGLASTSTPIKSQPISQAPPLTPLPDNVLNVSPAQLNPRITTQAPTPPTSSAPSPNTQRRQRSPPRASSEAFEGPSSPSNNVKTQLFLPDDDDESYFGTPAPEKPSEDDDDTPPRPRRAPVLHQGPYNKGLTDGEGRPPHDHTGRRRSGVKEIPPVIGERRPAVDAIEWPPKRDKRKGKGKEVAEANSENTAKEEPPSTQEVRKQLVEKNGHHPFSQPTQPTQPSASGSRDSIPPSVDNQKQVASKSKKPKRQHHPFSQPTQEVDSETDEEEVDELEESGEDGAAARSALPKLQRPAQAQGEEEEGSPSAAETERLLVTKETSSSTSSAPSDTSKEPPPKTVLTASELQRKLQEVKRLAKSRFGALAAIAAAKQTENTSGNQPATATAPSSSDTSSRTKELSRSISEKEVQTSQERPLSVPPVPPEAVTPAMRKSASVPIIQADDVSGPRRVLVSKSVTTDNDPEPSHPRHSRAESSSGTNSRSSKERTVSLPPAAPEVTPSAVPKSPSVPIIQADSLPGPSKPSTSKSMATDSEHVPSHARSSRAESSSANSGRSSAANPSRRVSASSSNNSVAPAPSSNDKAKQRAMLPPPPPPPAFARLPNRRHTMGDGYDLGTPARADHLRTRSSMPNPDTSQSSVRFSFAPILPANQPKYEGKVIMPEDLPMAVEHGMKNILGRMAENHGFAEGTAIELWKALGRLRKVDAALKHMRDAAKDAGEHIVHSFLEDDGADEDVSGGSGSRRVSTHGSSRNSSILGGAPWASETQSGVAGEYRPPRDSMAAEYARSFMLDEDAS
ncbi:hypothetical protein K474DRAFT_1665143 [Panus rudis PR-1116 ss-1]|nr:hypothetical protein K474DRAFT_1665143 [Panus rudis PR-1116 ss-1]